jgi:phi13 family phage major tail protein
MAAIINAKNVVYAKMVDETAKTYDTPVSISPLMTIKADTATSNDTLYGDGSPQESTTTTGSTTIEMKINDLPATVHSVLLGHALDATTGVMTEDEDDKAPYVALGWELEKGDGTSVFFWYLKGKFEEPAVDASQKEDKVTYSTPTLKGTFVYRSDGIKRYKMDEDAGTAVPSNFLSAVYSPTLDLVAPTVTTVPADAADNVVGTANLTLTFNKAIQANTATDDNIILIKADGTAVASVITIDAANEVVTISPTAPLTAAAEYILIVTTGIKSAAGVAMAADTVVNFTITA